MSPTPEWNGSKPVKCDSCGHPTAARIMDSGELVLSWENDECPVCGDTSYSVITEEDLKS